MSFQHISESIRSVGVDNVTETLFESQYPLSHGMSYNSYLILDSHAAILDSVEAGQGERWLANIEREAAGRTPDFLVVHHMEPDHSANIMSALRRWPSLQIVASRKAIQMLRDFFPDAGLEFNVREVTEGDTLALGTHSLRFTAAPMVHWPEVMVSYETHTGTLFSADAFGKFGAIQYHDDWTPEARRYYINIVGKYGNQVQQLLRKFHGIPVNSVAPLHGPILTGDAIGRAVALYDTWSSYRPETAGTLVAYASIYGGTARAALDLADMLRARDCGEIVVTDLCRCDESEAVAQAFRLSSLVLASATYDASLFPAMHSFIHHLGLKNFRNRRVGLIENGSWAPVAGRLMRKMLEPMPGLEIAPDNVTIHSRPAPADREALNRLADFIAAEQPQL